MRAVAALLAALLLLGLTACGQEETKEPETMGEILLQEFETQYQADPQADLDAMAQAILSQEVIGFQGTTAPVEPGTLMGFGGTDIQGFAQGRKTRFPSLNPRFWKKQADALYSCRERGYHQRQKEARPCRPFPQRPLSPVPGAGGGSAPIII